MNKHLALLPILLCFITISFAQTAGDIDTSFNQGAPLYLQPGNQHDNLYDLAVQSDGKIVFCGVGRVVATSGFSKNDIVVGRRNSNGSADLNFGTNGFVTKDFGIASDYGYNLALQADGKIIIVGGASKTTSGDVEWMIMRLLPNGAYDSTFNATGIVQLALGTSEDYAYDVALQPDGKLIVVGASKVPGFAYYRATIARLNSNGSLDSSFASNGIYKYQPPVTTNSQLFKSLVLLPSGNIIAAGYSSQGSTSSSFYMGFTSNGIVNSAFGANGIYSDPNVEKVYKIINVGDGIFSSGTRLTDATLAKIDTSGNIVMGFGSSGIAYYSANPSNAFYTLVAQSDGKMLLAGTASTAALARDFLVVRYLSTGFVDNTFGTNGSVVLSYGPSFEDVNAIALQADGKIVLGGFGAFADNDMIITRLLNDLLPSGLQKSDTDKPTSWIVFPSPNSGNEFFLSNNINPRQLQEVAIYNSIGEKLSNYNFNKQTDKPSLYKIELPSKLPVGIYFVHLIAENELTTLRLAIVK